MASVFYDAGVRGPGATDGRRGPPQGAKRQLSHEETATWARTEKAEAGGCRGGCGACRGRLVAASAVVVVVLDGFVWGGKGHLVVYPGGDAHDDGKGDEDAGQEHRQLHARPPHLRRTPRQGEAAAINGAVGARMAGMTGGR